jgi:hypothetical protein
MTYVSLLEGGGSMSCCSICGFAGDTLSTSSNASLEKSATWLYPIRTNGKPSGYLRGFICPRCLHEANKGRDHVKSLQADVCVSRHALDRFIERDPGERTSEDAATTAILKQFRHAQQIVFQPRFMVERLLNNGQPADYYFHAGWIFVVAQSNPRTIMTIERQGHRRLGRDFWYAKEPLSAFVG